MFFLINNFFLQNNTSPSSSCYAGESESPRMARPFQPIPMPYSSLHDDNKKKENDMKSEAKNDNHPLSTSSVGNPSSNKTNKKNKKMPSNSDNVTPTKNTNIDDENRYDVPLF